MLAVSGKPILLDGPDWEHVSQPAKKLIMAMLGEWGSTREPGAYSPKLTKLIARTRFRLRSRGALFPADRALTSAPICSGLRALCSFGARLDLKLVR